MTCRVILSFAPFAIYIFIQPPFLKHTAVFWQPSLHILFSHFDICTFGPPPPPSLSGEMLSLLRPFKKKINTYSHACVRSRPSLSPFPFPRCTNGCNYNRPTSPRGCSSLGLLGIPELAFLHASSAAFHWRLCCAISKRWVFNRKVATPALPRGLLEHCPALFRNACLKILFASRHCVFF